jgi:predicted GIY-YIG superfamily endonuclease
MPVWFCYMLVSTDGKRTYVGATVDPTRRLRQHNGELVGGARATKGRQWTRRFLVGGFEDERDALRFEWRWKWLTRQAPGLTYMDRRCHALSLLLSDWEGCEIIEDNDLSLSTGGE